MIFTKIFSFPVHEIVSKSAEQQVDCKTKNIVKLSISHLSTDFS